MNKTISDRLAAKAAGKKPLASNRNQNRAIFLALRQEIIQALGDGWSIKSIWGILHEEGKVAFGYASFWNYTKRLIQTPPGPPMEERATERGSTGDTSKTAKPATAATAAPEKEIPEIKGFTFNPSPKKEDLI
ncbi:TraK family protein [Geomonas azotofigens]|uniref:TraK family protein n=1 Tax=Geomonas azotofigens TaxID=2843196 RepID=UPI001C102528|nr:TraK family protein [Geomonas azotofigens]MBU5612641.1 TraK family protein [Geomonas azotofigens]